MKEVEQCETQAKHSPGRVSPQLSWSAGSHAPLTQLKNSCEAFSFELSLAGCSVVAFLVVFCEFFLDSQCF